MSPHPPRVQEKRTEPSPGLIEQRVRQALARLPLVLAFTLDRDLSIVDVEVYPCPGSGEPRGKLPAAASRSASGALSSARRKDLLIGAGREPRRELRRQGVDEDSRPGRHQLAPREHRP